MPRSAPTVAELARAHGAGFTFRCRPCSRAKLYSGAELVARVGAEETFASLVARTVCPGCRMPIDGTFRTFAFHCTADPAQWQALGLGDGGIGRAYGDPPGARRGGV
jgi:hypothetical protein